MKRLHGSELDDLASSVPVFRRLSRRRPFRFASLLAAFAIAAASAPASAQDQQAQTGTPCPFMGRTIRFPSGVPVASKFQLKNDKTPPELAELIDTCLATSGGTRLRRAFEA